MIEPLKPTDEQLDVISAISSTSDNILVNSLAGTGKTTMLEMIETALPKGKPILCLAFNKSTMKEMEKRFKGVTTVKTVNGMGHRIWAKTVSSVTLDAKKVQNLLKDVIKAAPKAMQSEAWDCYWEVINGVALAKALGYVPDRGPAHARRLITKEDFLARLEEEPSEMGVDLIDEILLLSIKTAYNGYIDFNDQVYMPALFGGAYPSFPTVMVDEFQDWNPVNHALLDKLVKGRLIAVGDPQQSIYGFRGAMNNGMADGKERFDMAEYTLSISFRCPRKVVEAARWRVPNFKWIKDGGIVGTLPRMVGTDFHPKSTIICRNNAPLFRVAFHLLSSGRSVSVAGTDIGPKLIGILRRLGDEMLPRSSVLGLITDWQVERQAKGSTTAQDMAEAMRVFAEHGETLGQAIAYAEHLFQQQGSIRLMTGHKAKGLEFDHVYHLDPWLCKDDEQDQNLRYVITTRSADRLYEVDARDIRW